jgi:hypothetical protein
MQTTDDPTDHHTSLWIAPAEAVENTCAPSISTFAPSGVRRSISASTARAASTSSPRAFGSVTISACVPSALIERIARDQPFDHQRRRREQIPARRLDPRRDVGRRRHEQEPFVEEQLEGLLHRRGIEPEHHPLEHRGRFEPLRHLVAERLDLFLRRAFARKIDQ